jgi:hypothetical protein
MPSASSRRDKPARRTAEPQHESKSARLPASITRPQGAALAELIASLAGQAHRRARIHFDGQQEAPHRVLTQRGRRAHLQADRLKALTRSSHARAAETRP